MTRQLVKVFLTLLGWAGALPVFLAQMAYELSENNPNRALFSLKNTKETHHFHSHYETR